MGPGFEELALMDQRKRRRNLKQCRGAGGDRARGRRGAEGSFSLGSDNPGETQTFFACRADSEHSNVTWETPRPHQPVVWSWVTRPLPPWAG